LAILALAVATAVLAVKFIGWPLNRDITWYATIARELRLGQRLYVDAWDIKPPAIFATYVVAQWAIPSERLQIFLLDLVPTLVVLAALVLSARRAGFSWWAGAWAGLLWIALSVDVNLQTQEPNTEIFINACTSLAFLQFLHLGDDGPVTRSLSIGLLFGLACLYKTVAIAAALVLGLTYLAMPSPTTRLRGRLRQLSVMALGGAASLAAVFGYFWATGRLGVFWRSMVVSGSGYAGDMLSNVISGLTFAPVAVGNPVLHAALAAGPWILIAAVAAVDRERARSWVLLAAYAFGSLVAVALPGKAYAHYFQLLLPPFCLGFGWVVAAAERLRWPRLRSATPVFAGLLVGGAMAHGLRVYRLSPEEALAGTYQDLYLKTQALGRRLGDSLGPDETLYQWGEESGLYWYGNKRPPTGAVYGSFALLRGPEAGRLTNQTLESLRSRPPDLIVAVDYMLDNGIGHPVFEWIRANYTAVKPSLPGERTYFTFYVPAGAAPEFVRRVLGSG